MSRLRPVTPSPVSNCVPYAHAPAHATASRAVIQAQ